MALRGTGLLALWGDVDGAGEDEFNDWYTHEHLPERIAVPGFTRARRYVGCTANERATRWRYFTVYETRDVAVLTSPAYMAALDEPTPRTRRHMPQFAAMSRTAMSVEWTRGGGGGNLAAWELGPAPGRADELRAHIVEAAGPALLERSGCLGCHLARAEPAGTDLRDTASYEGVSTTAARWLLLAEGAWPDIEPVVAEHLALAADLPAHGAAADWAYNMHRVLAWLEA